ncbi:acyl carrier protein [Slackia exigua]|uniref:acyl carrier protein n=1 Tax=Slackia exigua TaxID=84109 RepID=UPI0028E91A55|nr:phosphopantetheine-binding protein [Slackia exigua]
MDTLATIKAILNDRLDIDPESVIETSTFASLGIDSLDMVELVCELEDQLGIDFGEPEGIDDMAQLVAYVDGLR